MKDTEVRSEVNTVLFTYKRLTAEERASRLAEECKAAGVVFFEGLEKKGIALSEDNHVEILISLKPGMMGE